MSSYIFFALMITVVLIHQNFSPPKQGCDVKFTSPRNIEDVAFKITGVWAADFDIDQIRRDTFAIFSDKILVAGCGEVIAFDLQTGVIRWRVDELINPIDLTVDEVNNSVYVVGQQEVRALSLSSGETLWSNSSELFSRTAVSTSLLSNGQLVVRPGGRGTHYLDNLQGVLGEAIDLPGGTEFYDGDFIVTKGIYDVTVINGHSDAKLWDYEVTGDHRDSWEVNVYPEEDLMIIQWLSSLNERGLMSLRLTTGVVLWQWHESWIASKVQVENDKLWFLTDDARLIVLDMDDGEQLYSVQFSETFNRNIDRESSLFNSQVMVENNLIAIYFQDNNNLTVYEVVQ